MSNSKENSALHSITTESSLVWLDMEMSGLEPKTSVILEIATIITDNDLNIIAEGPNLVVHQSEAILEGMDDWNQKHHGASGLIRRVRESDISVAQAEEETLQFVRKHCDERKAPLCGNSIAQDRRFLRLYMPRLSDWLHYRNVDVSSFKEMIARWWPRQFSPPKKHGVHKALVDIRESIDELKYYRDTFLRPPETR